MKTPKRQRRKFAGQWVYADLWVRTEDLASFQEIPSPAKGSWESKVYTAAELDAIADEGYTIVAVYQPQRKTYTATELLESARQFASDWSQKHPRKALQDSETLPDDGPF